MCSRGVVAVLAVLPLLLGAEAWGEVGPSRPSRRAGELGAAPTGLRLAWLDVAGCAIGVSGIARDEAASVFARVGLDVRWRRASPSEVGRSDEVRVIVLDRLVVNPATRRPVLGSSPERKRESPFVWIHVKSIRAALGLQPGRPIYNLRLEHRRALGLALGRVAAHEVVHALAGDVPHGRGIMSNALDRRALAAPQLSFDPGVAATVRAALLGRSPSPDPCPEVPADVGEAAVAR